MEKGSIIIAEDDSVLREIYYKKFALNGYDIRTCENGEQAIAAVEERIPDVLILDVNMPVMDGFEVLSRFPKEQRPFPIIMLTNFGYDSNRKRGDELGADDYFIKSDMTIRKLMEMVQSLMTAKKYFKK
ncbi:MAG: response regulator [bacterium]|nr:response regulator [bacterium]